MGSYDPAKTVFHINNGVDLTVFDENRVNFPFEDVDLQQKDVFAWSMPGPFAV